MRKVHEAGESGNIAVVSSGRGKDARQLIQAGGWELSVWRAADDEPRIRDVDLAERLGFERPRKIREVIERNFQENQLPYCRPTVGRQSTGNGASREYVVTEYWLTEEEALFIVTRSRTTKATALTREMIRVFIAVRRGLMVPKPRRRRTVSAAVEQLGAVVGELASAVQMMALAVSSLADRVEGLEARLDQPAPASQKSLPEISAETTAQRIVGYLDAKCGPLGELKDLQRAAESLGLHLAFNSEFARIAGCSVYQHNNRTVHLSLPPSSKEPTEDLAWGLAAWGMEEGRVSSSADATHHFAATTRAAELLAGRWGAVA